MQLCTTFTDIELKPVAQLHHLSMSRTSSSSGLFVEVIADGEIQVENNCCFFSPQELCQSQD